MPSLSSRFIDSYSGSSVSSRARERRWHEIQRRYPDLAEMDVVDLGGDIRSWRIGPVQPRRLLLVNTFEQSLTEPWAEAVVADACDLPASITSKRFDLVYSNSVMEHVGGHYRRQRFAEAALALGQHLWIQTPYRYFPIEPHWLFPGFQLLPVAGRARAMGLWPAGNYPRDVPHREAVRHVLNIELLSATEMNAYFPGVEIWRERVLGLTKSLVAAR